MRTITDIYAHYRIPDIVVRHQLRVAAVAHLVGERIPGVALEPLVRVGLFHDMGNILKMDLSSDALLIDLIAPDSLENLRTVYTDFTRRYGTDEHAASMAIARESGLSDAEITMIDAMRYSKTERACTEAPISMKIIKYADLRVAPQGIVSMHERMDEAERRYRGRSFEMGMPLNAQARARIIAMCEDMEKYLCATAGIRAEDISDSSAAPTLEQLKNYVI